MSSSTAKMVERISGRVFCQGSGGGNPVTIFATPTALSASIQKRLAKGCDWESVMVAKHDERGTNPMERKKLAEFAFYMPSGQQVNFCAHAAMGAAFAVANRTEWSFRTATLGEGNEPSQSQSTQNTPFAPSQIYKASLPSSFPATDDNKNAIVYMEMPFSESKISHAPGLQRMLREHLGLASSHLVTKAQYAPTFVNASVARPKTLVYVNSLDALANVEVPKTTTSSDGADTDGTGAPRTSFSMACEAMDNSTGVYLYTNRDEEGRTTSALTAESISWECRQFPKASGYPEDPATGIAAAALAASFYRQGLMLKEYNFYQGTHMNRPSLIQVVDMMLQETYDDSGKDSGDETESPILATFGLKGRVEIDERGWVEVDEEEES